MPIGPLAGQPSPDSVLIDVNKLIGDYYDIRPDVTISSQKVSFGTSGHRGTSTDGSFNEWHILAVTQAIVEYRAKVSITGPLFMGMDTHALSDPAQRSALEVLAANDVDVFIAAGDGAALYTPTPAISRAILTYNAGRTDGFSDGIVITPSHNPPADGGFKYNPPNGGPADTDITGWVQERANAILKSGGGEIKRLTSEQALRASTTHRFDFITPYVDALSGIIDLDPIRASGITIGADPLGGASLGYWDPIIAKYGLNITVVNRGADPTFRFMTLDHDGKIRMDCSSPYAMAKLVGLKDKYRIAFGNDTDSDRHGIVTPGHGLLNPNHFLSASIWYLFGSRSHWRADAAIGKTVVSSSMIDRVGKMIGRRVSEVPVGFKWFVDGLLDGSYGFGGEESAGASFLQKDASVWTTDKDGIILDLLAAEMTVVTGKDPGEIYDDLTAKLGAPIYKRVDQAATPEEKNILKKLSPESVKASELAGELITDKLTRAPGNNQEIGGLKVVTENGWFAARPSGTENVYKIYAESFINDEHLERILSEAREIVSDALKQK